MVGSPRIPVRTLTAALLLAAGVFLLPGQAEAGCGEPLLTTSGKPPPGHQPQNPAPAPQDPIRLPCHGPGCSGDPTPHDSPLSLPTTSAPDSKSWAADSPT